MMDAEKIISHSDNKKSTRRGSNNEFNRKITKHDIKDLQKDIKHLGEKMEINIKHLEEKIEIRLSNFQENFVTKEYLIKISNKIIWSVITSMAAIIVFITDVVPFIIKLLNKNLG